MGSPWTTRLKFPFSFKLKTINGSRLSIQRLMAVESMTFRFWVRIDRKGISVIFLGLRIFDGIAVVDAVDFGAFHDDLRADFHCPERRGRVGREIGISGSTGKNHHTVFFQMPDGATSDIALRQLAHFDRRLDTGGDPFAFQRILEASAFSTVASMPM